MPSSETDVQNRFTPPVRASAPGKAILCGEHAVVYGQPAIALPIMSASARATVRAARRGIHIRLPDINQRLRARRGAEHPLLVLAQHTVEHLGVGSPALDIKLKSTIPIASGMGSGAALGAALVRGIAAFYNRPIDAATVSNLVYVSERMFHGKPSGIDNTVVSYEQPVWYQRDRDGTSHLEALHVGAPVHLVIADTGVRAPTRLLVGGVAERWAANLQRYDRWFAEIGALVRAARDALQTGEHERLGALLDKDHTLLQLIGVSSPELDQLVAAARDAGALGAKLSGGGGGGIMLALVTPANAENVGACDPHRPRRERGRGTIATSKQILVMAL
jgi:mevalonate kinase